MHSLPVFLRLARRPVILLGTGETVEAKRRLLLRAGALVVGEDEKASLAIVAIEDNAAAEAAVARLRKRGILINAVDRPALCDFTLPAIVDRDPVLIAIGTGGTSAGLAKALRQRIEALLPPRLGLLAEVLYRARSRIRARFPDASERRRAIDAALDPGGPLDPLDDDPQLDGWLAGLHGTAPAIVHIALRSADPDDLTLRDARWLARADIIYHDASTPPAILRRARADARCIQSAIPNEPSSGVVLVLHGPS